MYDQELFDPEFIFTIRTPKGGWDDDEMREITRMAADRCDKWIDDIDLRCTEDSKVSTYQVIISFTETCTLETRMYVETIAAEVCENILNMFPSNDYGISWAVRYTSKSKPIQKEEVRH